MVLGEHLQSATEEVPKLCHLDRSSFTNASLSFQLFPQLCPVFTGRYTHLQFHIWCPPTDREATDGCLQEGA